MNWKDDEYLSSYLDSLEDKKKGKCVVTEKKNTLIRGLAPAIDSGLNVLLSGLHGIGKTYAVMEAIDDLGLEMKYYSTSTLDPYVDLVGVPVPVDREDSDKKQLEMVRPDDINNVDVVFFDELNRADPKTLNAVFELVQFRTINGESLPRLKSIVAAINPTDGAYNTEELDPALLDRFHVFWQIDPKAPTAYLKERYDSALVDAFILWWGNHKSSKREYYVSPRRLEYMIENYATFGTFEMLKHSVPPGALLDWNNLKSNIKVAEAGGDVGDISTDSFPDKIKTQQFWTKKNVAENYSTLESYFDANPNDAIAGQQFHNFLVNNPRIGMPFIKSWMPLILKREEVDTSLLTDIRGAWSFKKVRQIANFCYQEYANHYSGGNGRPKDVTLGDKYYKAYRALH